MNNPRISIDRQSKSFAIFEGHFTKVYGFEKYDDEDAALAKAKAIVAEKTDKEPEVVYPQITSMRVSYGRSKRKA